MDIINFYLELFNNLEGFKRSKKKKGVTRPPLIWKSKPNIKEKSIKTVKKSRKCKIHRRDRDYDDYDDYDDYNDYDDYYDPYDDYPPINRIIVVPQYIERPLPPLLPEAEQDDIEMKKLEPEPIRDIDRPSMAALEGYQGDLSLNILIMAIMAIIVIIIAMIYMKKIEK